MLAPEPRSNPKTDKPDLTTGGFNEDVGRLDVLVNQLSIVQPTECTGETNGELQKLRQLHCTGNESLERDASRIFQHERRLLASFSKRYGPRCPMRIEF